MGNLQKENLNFLIIEDSTDDALLLINNLKKSGIKLVYEIVDNEKDFKEKITSNAYDVIIDDFNVPGFDGPDALKVLKEYNKDIPFIVVSGSLSSDEVIEILKSGAHDYIDKNNLTRLSHAVLREITEAKIRAEKKQYELDLINSAKTLEKAFEQTIETISIILEKKDPYTSGHQKRVAILAAEIAKLLGFSMEEQKKIYYTSLIHDIGKIVLPISILSKPNKLSHIEIDMIKTHPIEGYEILKNNDFLKPFGEIIYQHHERLNGSGYPVGLKNSEILIEAKIIAVADVFEAMLSHRPYRPALGIKQAIAELKKNRGILYDCQAVDACIKLFLEKGFNF